MAQTQTQTPNTQNLPTPEQVYYRFKTQMLKLIEENLKDEARLQYADRYANAYGKIMINAIERLELKDIEGLIKRGWNLNDVKADYISIYYDCVELTLRVPSGLSATLIVHLKGTYDLTKQEYTEYKKAKAIAEKIALQTEIKKLESFIEYLKQELANCRESKNNE